MPLCPPPPRIVAKKGQKKVRYRTSGQKSQVTVIGCGSATGQVIPPFIIFSGKQINLLWTLNGVNGSRFAVSDNGWIDQELFKFWLSDHFLPNAYHTAGIKFARHNRCRSRYHTPGIKFARHS